MTRRWLAKERLLHLGALAGAALAGAVLAGGCDSRQVPEEARKGAAGESGQVGCATALESAAVAVVNQARRQASAPVLGCLSKLSAVAAEHAAFLAANEGLSLASAHAEAPGRPHFRGVTLGERGDAGGLDRQSFWLSEGVGGGGAAAAIVATHLATVYHRSQLLTPSARYLAVAVAQGQSEHAVLNSLAAVRVDGLAPALYPGPGQSAVPLSFGPAHEVPDPLPDVANPGFPVSVHFPRPLGPGGREAGPPVVRSFTLVAAATGAAVAGRILSAATDPEVYRSDVFFVPFSPLQAATEYQARVDADFGPYHLARNWTFTTKAE